MSKIKFFLTALITLITIYAAQASAATFTVTNTNDSGAGSLRQAILDANAAIGADTIVFDASFNTPRTITLASLLTITNGGGVTINGPGRDLLSISGNNQTRVFEINDANAGANFAVTFNNFTVINAAQLSAGFQGAAIGMNNGSIPSQTFQINLTLNNIAAVNVPSNNVAPGVIGCSRSGTVNINNSYIANNRTAPLVIGSNLGGCSLAMDNTTIEKNSSGSDGQIVCCFGNVSPTSMSVTNSTINDNVGGNNGYFRISLEGTATFTNTTIVRNRTNNNAAVVLNGGNAVLTNVTIAGNFVNGVGSPSAGLWAGGTSGTFTVKNSIIANNFNPNGTADFWAASAYPFSSSYSLIESVASGSLPVPTTNGNLIGVDALLDGALRNYGGATKTLALRRGSPAIDAGDPATFPATDQRGVARPQDGDGNGAARSDMGAFERRPIDVVRNRIADFDNDGQDDLSVFRPSNGTWYLQQSNSDFTGVAFGQNGDQIVPADYDGDGRTDVAVFRGGIWYLQRSSLGFTGIAFGQSGDIPVPGDYDGDERDDIAVFRPSNGTWYLLRSSLGFTGFLFGQNGDKPVAADYDGDRKADIAVNRGGIWYLQRSQLGFTGIQFGDGNDKLVPADYDGDGKTDLAVFRPSNGVWYLQQSAAGFVGIAFGIGTDIPATADYDGDGKADIAVVRNGTWYLNRSTQGFTGVVFGAGGDLPIPNAYVR